MEAVAIRAEDHLRFAWAIAHRWSKAGLPPCFDLDELFAVASLGLVKAAQSFDPSKGTWSTYAGRCMHNEIRMAVRSAGRDGKREALRLDAPAGEDGDATVGEFIPDDSAPQPGEALETRDERRRLWAAVDGLKPRARDAVRLVYGGEGMEQAKAATLMGISRPYVNRLVLGAQRTLRRRLEATPMPQTHGQPASLGLNPDAIRRMTLRGMTRAEIAAHYGTTEGYVASWCSRNGVPRPPAGQTRDPRTLRERAQDLHRVLGGGDLPERERLVLRPLRRPGQTVAQAEREASDMTRPLGIDRAAVEEAALLATPPEEVCVRFGVTAEQFAKWLVNHRVAYPGCPRSGSAGVAGLQTEIDRILGKSTDPSAQAPRIGTPQTDDRRSSSVRGSKEGSVLSTAQIAAESVSAAEGGEGVAEPVVLAPVEGVMPEVEVLGSWSLKPSSVESTVTPVPPEVLARVVGETVHDEGVMPAGTATALPHEGTASRSDAAAAPMNQPQGGGAALPRRWPPANRERRSGGAHRVTIHVKDRNGAQRPIDLLCDSVAAVDAAVTFGWVFGLPVTVAPWDEAAG